MTTTATIQPLTTAEPTLVNIKEAPKTELLFPEIDDSSSEPPEIIESTPEPQEVPSKPIADAQATQPGQSPPETAQQRFHILGAISWLMLQSPLHRNYTIEELEARILPSLIHNQFRYYEIQGKPIGFMSWANLSADAEQQYQTGDYQLLPEEWQSGERLWCIDFIAPFGHDHYILDDVRQTVFPEGTIAKTIQTQEDGSRSIIEYRLGDKS